MKVSDHHRKLSFFFRMLMINFQIYRGSLDTFGCTQIAMLIPIYRFNSKVTHRLSKTQKLLESKNLNKHCTLVKLWKHFGILIHTTVQLHDFYNKLKIACRLIRRDVWKGYDVICKVRHRMSCSEIGNTRICSGAQHRSRSYIVPITFLKEMEIKRFLVIAFVSIVLEQYWLLNTGICR